MLSSDAALGALALRCAMLRPARKSARSRAWRSPVTAENASPASGVPFKPSISTGIDGAACSTASPRSLLMARTRP